MHGHCTFSELAKQGYNRIPVAREVLADLDTPLSTYLKLAHGRYSYLFESVHGGEKWGRYSIIGLPCRTVLRVFGNDVNIERDGKIVERETVADPLEYVRQFRTRYEVADIDGLPRFTVAWWVISVMTRCAIIEPRLGACDKPDRLGTPDILLMVSEEVLVFDNLAGKLCWSSTWIPALTMPGAGAARLRQLVGQLRSGAPEYRSRMRRRPSNEQRLRLRLHPRGLRSAVERIKEYILAGDVHAGGAVAAHVDSVCRAAAGSVPRPAQPQSIALHVFPGPGRFSHRRLLAGNPGAPGRRRWSPCGRLPVPAAAGGTRRKTRRWRRNCWPIPRNSPST